MRYGCANYARGGLIRVVAAGGRRPVTDTLSVMILRTLALCVALAGTETLHGIVRTVWLVPRLGKERALKLSAFSGSLLALLVCCYFVPGLGLDRLPEQLLLGGLLAAFMASFDIAMGLLLMRKPFRKVATDFDPRSGNWLLFGLVALVFMPALAMAIAG